MSREDVEAKARQMGWAPKDEWKGDPDNWKDADEFLEIGENRMPVLKERLSKMQETLDGLSNKLSAVEKSNRMLSDFNKNAYKKAYNQALKDIKAGKERAVEDSDIETYRQLEKEEERLTKEAADNFPEEEPEDLRVSTEFENFQRNNSWYNGGTTQEAEMTMYAEGVAKMLQSNLPAHINSDADFYREIEKKVQYTFPKYFRNERKNSPPDVEDGDLGGDPKPKSKKGWSDLPKEAKDAYHEYFDYLDKKEYAKNYWEES